jgi:hypothetical protein
MPSRDGVSVEYAIRDESDGGQVLELRLRRAAAGAPDETECAPRSDG